MTNRHPRNPLPAHTWLGLIILIAGQLLYFLGVRIVIVWLTPIMWTGYILLVDGFVYKLRGGSWLTSRKREFPFLALSSVAVWLVFEVYNFRLANWAYFGVPETPWLRNLAYLWSFATIMPGVFETFDLLRAMIDRLTISGPTRITFFPIGPAGVWFALGIGLVTIPPMLPADIAAYLFAPVWIGYIFVFDPIIEHMGLPSLRQSLSNGTGGFVLLILAAGLICGFLWETWNYQAFLANGGHWIYTVPEGLRPFGWHFGQMPVLGLLGFPPFALELTLIYAFIRRVFGINQWMPEATRLEHPLLPWQFIENQ